ncbi:hypothetical protein [Lactococcus lactis]|uniref:Glycosyltransferase n=1 Tax=Lactococcus lactis TaxID=1358 RepID=A0A3Q9TCP9_9LACT|nr:hypothetical protein [Lactococcus lactis]AZY91816.1 glycosyltransferase [Lactococcus lactis]MDM7498893.1 hypothetical protein [Lactococcus lactis]
MNIFFLSHTEDGGIYKVGSHHLSREFSKMGNKVTHISTPISFPQLLIGKGSRSRIDQAKNGAFQDKNGVIQIVDKIPFPLRILNQNVIISHQLISHGILEADFILMDQPLFAPALSKLDLKGKIIYRPTDVYLEGSMVESQKVALKIADGVIATSHTVLNNLNINSDLPKHVEENGVEFYRFYSKPSKINNRDNVVYLGSLDERFDWGLIRYLAIKFSDLKFDLYGTIRNFDPRNNNDENSIILPPNIRLLGPVPYEEVPYILKKYKIGLLPFVNNELNQGRSPMKLYEYLASGLNVVSLRTRTLEQLNLPCVELYDNTKNACIALEKANKLNNSSILGVESAKKQDWSNKTKSILNFMKTIEGT